jgi:hypothetical protein
VAPSAQNGGRRTATLDVTAGWELFAAFIVFFVGVTNVGCGMPNVRDTHALTYEMFITHVG